MSRNELLWHHKAFWNFIKPGISLISLRHVYKWNIMTAKSLEKTQNSCNWTQVTWKWLEMNYNDIRKPPKTSWSLEFPLYRSVMSRNQLLRHKEAFLNFIEHVILLISLRHVYKWNIMTSGSIENLEIPVIPLRWRHNV